MSSPNGSWGEPIFMSCRRSFRDSGIETERRYRGAQKKGGVMTAIDIRSQTVEAIYAAYVANAMNRVAQTLVAQLGDRLFDFRLASRRSRT